MIPAAGTAPRVRVVCIGNNLIGDDAAGYEVYRILTETALPSDMGVTYMEMAGIDLLDELRGEQVLIIVDAVRFGAQPGTLHLLPWEEIPRASGLPVSAHGIGVRESIEIGRILYSEKMPRSVYLLGIEGDCFDTFGESMTPQVRSAARVAADLVLRCADLLLHMQSASELPPHK
jgi:hydrogenase maturation protease